MNRYLKLVVFGYIFAVIFCFAAARAATTFKAPKDATQGQANGVQVMDAGDINGDGMADVVAICGGMHANSSIFAWFEAPSTIGGTWTRHNFGNDSQLRAFLGACILHDFDKDGDLDLVVSSDNHHGSTMKCDLYVYVNPGPSRVTGSWSYQRVTSSTQPWNHVNDIAVDDMDSDGKPDIICRSLEPNQIHVFFQNSISSWTRKTFSTGISQSEGLAVGDINKDGRPDIEYTGFWLKAPSSPRTGTWTKLKIDDTYKNTNQNTKEDLGDIDGDGDLDLVLAPAEHYRSGGNHILAWYSNPGGTPGNTNWTKHTLVTNLNDIGQVKLRDLDDDGDLDIIYGHCFVSPYYIKVFYNNGSGGFGSASTVSSSKGLYTCRIMDFDGDGDLDIAGNETYANGTRVWVYENLKYSGSVTKYTLTVTKGSGDGSYAAGTKVTISADAPGAGQAFDKWTGGSGIADVNASTTTITMPAANTTVTATYRTVVTYMLSVTNGTGDGNYEAGAKVSVKADAAPSGKAFDAWTGDTGGLSSTTSSTATYTMGTSAASITATYKDVPTGQYAYGGTPHAVPGRIEAEHYDEGGQNVAYYDNSTGNRGGALRTDDVDIYPTPDGGTQYKIGYNAGDEWVEYTVNAEAGVYTLRFRVATIRTDGTVGITIAGQSVGTVSVPNTGGWDAFTDIELPGVSLSAGEQVVRLAINGSGWDLNWIEFEKQAVVADTQAVSGTGSVAFGATGVSLNVLSLTGSDDITVETYTDSFPPNLPGSAPVKRFFHVSAGAGISGIRTVLTFSYTQDEFDASDITDESSLYCARYDGSSWIPFASVVDVANNTVSCTTIGFSIWAIGGEGAALPVQLSSFTASASGNTVALAWTTASEQGCLGFNVLRSADADGPFVKVNDGMIAGAGTTGVPQNYSFNDEDVATGTWYYRLEQKDVNGSSFLGAVIPVSVQAAGIAVIAPVSEWHDGQVRVLRIDGTPVAPGQRMSAGMYIMVHMNANGETVSRMVKYIR